MGNGKFVWYDLMTKDPEASLAFYTELIGWTSSVMDLGGVPYTLLSAGERMIGGVMGLEDAQLPPHWIGYVQVEDIEATCQLAEELGGKVCVPPTEIPGIGRFAVLTDPLGAAISPLQPAEASEMPEWVNAPGVVNWNEYMASDVTTAFGFYSLLFGWAPAGAMKSDESPGSYFLAGKDQQRPCVGLMKSPPPMDTLSYWLFYISVEDCAKSVEKAQALGAKLLAGPMPVPGGTAAVLVDPQGAAFGLYGDAPTP
ncbi:MAG: VOC family protein [Myxococcota bacterium]|jgi:predicted enzyme related to lactoylglutathione lyase|nr:VOC family protein [Myxococcota bacterium]